VLNTEDAVKQVVKDIKTAGVFALDTETTEIDLGRSSKHSPAKHGRILVFSVAFNHGTGYCLDRKWLPYFEEVLLDPEIITMWANVKFDMHMLANHGYYVKGQKWDTLVMDSLFNENRAHGLKDCGRDYTTVDMQDFNDVFSYVPEGKKKRIKIPLEVAYETMFQKLATYAAKDAVATFRVAVFLKNELEKVEIDDNGRNLWNYYLDFDEPSIDILFQMEREGIVADDYLLDNIATKCESRLRELEVQFYNITKNFNLEYPKPTKARANVIRSFLSSPKRLEDLYFSRFKLAFEPVSQTNGTICDACGKSLSIKTNNLCPTHGAEFVRNKNSTDGKTREKLLKKYNHPVVKVIDEHAKMKTFYQTFVNGLRQCVRENERIHFTLNQHVTVTGRLSSSNPVNSQNIPNNEKDIYGIRECFICPDGYEVLGGDYSMIELRLLAHFCQDPDYLDQIANDKDLHSFVAKKIWCPDVPIELIKHDRPDERRKAKTINFGLNYGMMARTLSERLECTVQEAQLYIDDYFRIFPGIREYMFRMKNIAAHQGYVTTLCGRRRRVKYLNKPDATPMQRIHEENQVVNFPIQGSAAEIIKCGMANVYYKDPQKFNDLGLRFTNQVHDEIVMIVPTKHAEEAKQYVRYQMERPFAQALTVPIIFDIETGPSWYDVH
jgi:DNA polymerase-1